MKLPRYYSRATLDEAARYLAEKYDLRIRPEAALSDANLSDAKLTDAVSRRG